MFELKVISQFAAAHRLKMVDIKCENLHGHNWKVEVCVEGKRLNPAGVLIDFGELKQHVKHIMEELDHKFLNDIGMFNDQFPPSSENIAFYIAGRLQRLIDDSDVRVSRVTTWESDSASATYIP